SFCSRRREVGVCGADTRRKSCNLGMETAGPKAHLPENPLALTHSELHSVAASQMLRERRPVPERAVESKFPGSPAQIRLQPAPQIRAQRARSAGFPPFTQSSQPALLEATDP